ncbi:cell division protein FtsQ/DivIB [Corynebacterium tuscaniense]|nr:FtsQ-type POTRA domain-containing protein [Corynebacterium tuscaniense]
MKRVAAISAAIVVALAVLWSVVYFTPLMSVKHFQVEGNAHISEEDAVRASGIRSGTPLAQVKLRDAAAGVVALPWVKSATASRGWPSTIKLTVIENDAVAFFSQENGAHLLDADGREFAVDVPPENAVELTGAAGTDEAVRKGAVDIAGALSDQGRENVEAIEARGKHDYVLHVKEGRTVTWGASEDNRNKSLALDTVLHREGAEFNITNPQLVTVR